MWKKAALIVICVGIMLPGNACAQERPRKFSILFQASVGFEKFNHDWKHLGSLDRETVTFDVQKYYLAVTPALRIGNHTAIEMEIGYRYTSVKETRGETREPVIEKASMYIPHLVVSFNALDSVLVPFVRGGIGLMESGVSGRGSADVPFVYSVGAGGMYLAGDRIFFRGELNYRAHHSVSGSNVRLTIDWSGFSLFFGIGYRP